MVFLLDSRGVAGAVHQSHENIKVVSKVNTAAVAELHRRTLASKKNAFREDFRSDISGLEDHLFAGSGGIVSPGAVEMPEGKTQKQECEENGRPRKTRHGNSFQNAGIV